MQWRCWEHITADFLTEFLVSRKCNDSVLVVVYKLSKRLIFIPTTTDVTSQEVHQLLEAQVLPKHGVPSKLTSVRDQKFTAGYSETVIKSEGIGLNMYSTAHPETDGQSERSVQTLCNIVRPVIQIEKENWDGLPPELEFELNSTKQ